MDPVGVGVDLGLKRRDGVRRSFVGHGNKQYADQDARQMFSHALKNDAYIYMIQYQILVFICTINTIMWKLVLKYNTHPDAHITFIYIRVTWKHQQIVTSKTIFKRSQTTANRKSFLFLPLQMHSHITAHNPAASSLSCSSGAELAETGSCCQHNNHYRVERGKQRKWRFICDIVYGMNAVNSGLPSPERKQKLGV